MTHGTHFPWVVWDWASALSPSPLHRLEGHSLTLYRIASEPGQKERGTEVRKPVTYQETNLFELREDFAASWYCDIFLLPANIQKLEEDWVWLYNDRTSVRSRKHMRSICLFCSYWRCIIAFFSAEFLLLKIISFRNEALKSSAVADFFLATTFSFSLPIEEQNVGPYMIRHITQKSRRGVEWQ